MVACAYCEKPLICEECGTEYAPPTAEAYEALSRPEATVICMTCEKPLVCHWCKSSYGNDDETDEP